ncbi:MAG: XRE family transcriptional regulator [Planctomycetia bacterium]|nr:XRE family transcriptional regulator [Planctomycetia bacterium]
MASTVNLADLGRRVKAVRIAHRMTLDEVVTRTGFTVSWLSKLENGQLSPSLEGLVRLADALQCGVDSLVEGLSVPPRFVRVKKGAGRLDGSRSKWGPVAEQLADGWHARAMDPEILHLPRSVTRLRPENHQGERFLMVLEGDVKITYGDDLIHLAPGDSLYLCATVPHAIAAAGRGTAKVLSVSCDTPNGHAGNGRAAKRSAAR